MLIHNVIRMIIAESFESDKKDLTSLYPEEKNQILALGPKWISWLSSRFGTHKTRDEVHPFEDSMKTILAFSKKDSAIAQKYASSEQWKNAVDEKFPSHQRKWKIPSDASTMTVDDMETLLAMSERKKQNVDVKGANIGGDFLGKVGPWNLWMPSTRENSCAIAGSDPLTGKSATTWCTARTSGSNLFYNYVTKQNQNVILFYVIKDNASDVNDRLSIGFVNGEPVLDGGHGGLSVNAENDGLTPTLAANYLGSHFGPIMSILSKKSKSTEGQHPAKKKIEEAANDVNAFHEILRGLSTEEAIDMKISIAQQKQISLEVGIILAKEKSFHIRSYLAGNENVTVEILNFLAKDENSVVRTYVATNKTSSVETLQFLSKDENENVRNAISRNNNATPEILQFFVNDESEYVRAGVLTNANCPSDILMLFAKSDKRPEREMVASNAGVTPEILAMLANDSDYYVRCRVATNQKTPIEILKFLSKDEVRAVKSYVVENPNTPIETLQELVYDNEKTIRNAAREKLESRMTENVVKRLLRYMR